MFFMMQVPKTVKPKEKMVKRCKYPNCGEIIMGYGQRKYCHEHSKDEYKKELYHDKYRKQESVIFDIENQRIDHKFFEVVTRIYKCECCGEKFEIKILPRVYVYPKFCEEHRNEWRRELWIRNNGVLINEQSR